MERELIEEFLRRLGKELSKMKDAFEEIYETICANAEAPVEDFQKPSHHHTSDFTCSRWCFRHRDLVPWHTAGFK